MKVNPTYSIILSLVAFVFVVLLPVEVKANKTNVRDYIQAAEAGNVDAQYSLSVMYRHGSGVTKNLQTSRYWLGKAVEQGDSRAQYDLAMSYYKGEGIVQNILLAERLFERSASQGHIEAQRTLGVLYDDGFGPIKKDRRKAHDWKLKAAEQGHTEAEYEYAFYVRFSRVDEAFKYYKRAAGKHDIRAIYGLGRAYEKGYGTEKNIKEAKELYRIGVKIKDPFAQYALGRLLLLEKGSEGEGLILITKAAEAGLIDASYVLAEIYIEGKLVPRDVPRAEFWIKNVIGHPLTNCLGQTYKNCSGSTHGISLYYKIIGLKKPGDTARMMNIVLQYRERPKGITEMR